MRLCTMNLLLSLLAVIALSVGVAAEDGAVGSVVDDRLTPATALSVLDADTVPSPGIAIGVTSYDRQHNWSQGHQIATNPGSKTVHFAWTMWDVIPDWAEETNRFVNYSSWDKPTGTTNQGPDGTTITVGDYARGGFVRIDVDGDNLCHVTLHQRIQIDFPYSAWHLLFPIEGSGLHLDEELAKSTTFPDEVEHLWPDVAISQNHGIKSSGTDVWHVISTGAVDMGGGYPVWSSRLWYWRYDRDDIWPTWVGPVLIDSASALSHTIDACDDSGKVAMALTSDWATDNLNRMNNVVYRESRTGGVGWLNGLELGESNKNIITAYDDTLGGPEAGSETSIAYDHRGMLHIIFTEQRSPGSEETALKHWSNERGTVCTITEAHYANPATWGRLDNLGQISLGIGDGATLCRGGVTDNSDYLYVLYTQLGGATPAEEADVSARGYANGELYLTVSPNGGVDWSPPANLTNTRTPDCNSDNPDSTCASEAWGTLARDVSDIEILYVRDYEAAAFDESAWTLNKVMYLNLPGGTTDAVYLCWGGCQCPCFADPICDGIVNVLDVVRVIDVAFRDCPAAYDPWCPRATSDVDCSQVTDILDVVRVVNVAFRGGDPETEFCEGCP